MQFIRDMQFIFIASKGLGLASQKTIPWDCVIEVHSLRISYLKVIKIYESCLQERVSLITINTT